MGLLGMIGTLLIWVLVSDREMRTKALAERLQMSEPALKAYLWETSFYLEQMGHSHRSAEAVLRVWLLENPDIHWVREYCQSAAEQYQNDRRTRSFRLTTLAAP